MAISKLEYGIESLLFQQMAQAMDRKLLQKCACVCKIWNEMTAKNLAIIEKNIAHRLQILKDPNSKENANFIKNEINLDLAKFNAMPPYDQLDSHEKKVKYIKRASVLQLAQIKTAHFVTWESLIEKQRALNESWEGIEKWAASFPILIISMFQSGLEKEALALIPELPDELEEVVNVEFTSCRVKIASIRFMVTNILLKWLIGENRIDDARTIIKEFVSNYPLRAPAFLKTELPQCTTIPELAIFLE